MVSAACPVIAQLGAAGGWASGRVGLRTASRQTARNRALTSHTQRTAGTHLGDGARCGAAPNEWPKLAHRHQHVLACGKEGGMGSGRARGEGFECSRDCDRGCDRPGGPGGAEQQAWPGGGVQRQAAVWAPQPQAPSLAAPSAPVAGFWPRSRGSDSMANAVSRDTCRVLMFWGQQGQQQRRAPDGFVQGSTRVGPQHRGTVHQQCHPAGKPQIACCTARRSTTHVRASSIYTMNE